jgi:membrane-associated phospholipid phosphatase
VFQRIYDDKHWASDTILAAVIGYTIGKAVVKLDSNQKLNNVSVSTYYLPNGAGLNLKFSF